MGNRNGHRCVEPGMDELWDIALWESEWEQYCLDHGVDPP